MINPKTIPGTGRKIWLCRHGNRMDFVDPNWKGSNPPLSPDGVVQARETAVRLRSESIHHIFASPFLRAIESAHHIAEALGLLVKIEHGACEWLNPEWLLESPQFPVPQSLIEQFPTIDTGYESIEYPDYPESWEQCMARCGRTVNKLINNHTGNILVVGHGATVEGLARGLSHSTEPISTGLCALTMLQESNGIFSIKLNGDISHLSGGSLFESRLV